MRASVPPKSMNKRPAIYDVWNNMIRRCYNPNNPAFKYYGMRGIVVCNQWRTFQGFARDMGPSYVIGLTLERRDNQKGYEPSNCYWATRKEQMRNTRRTNRITFNGETMCLHDWARKLGVVDGALRTRIKLHGVQVALTKEKFVHAN